MTLGSPNLTNCADLLRAYWGTKASPPAPSSQDTTDSFPVPTLELPPSEVHTRPGRLVRQPRDLLLLPSRFNPVSEVFTATPSPPGCPRQRPRPKNIHHPLTHISRQPDHNGRSPAPRRAARDGAHQRRHLSCEEVALVQGRAAEHTGPSSRTARSTAPSGRAQLPPAGSSSVALTTPPATSSRSRPMLSARPSSARTSMSRGRGKAPLSQPRQALEVLGAEQGREQEPAQLRRIKYSISVLGCPSCVSSHSSRAGIGLPTVAVSTGQGI